MIITSVAGIYSLPFVPLVARVLKNKDMVVPGVLTGIIGWVIGTYWESPWLISCTRYRFTCLPGGTQNYNKIREANHGRS